MDEIEYRLDQSRKRVFFNALISIVSDIIILVLLLKTGSQNGWPVVIPVIVVMALVMLMHGRAITFQLGYVPQYISDRLQGRTARDMIEESAAAAGIPYHQIAEDLMAGPEEFQYMGEQYIYFFYVDKVYIARRDEIAWFYFSGWRLMTRLFHWEVFYLPHIGLANGEVIAPMGYVFTRDEYDKFMEAGPTMLPRAVLGINDKLSRLFAFDREKFLAIRFAPNDALLNDAERAGYLDAFDDPSQNVKGMTRSATLKLFFIFLAGILAVMALAYYLTGNAGIKL